ncbi:MAG: NAD(P)H-hydrate dehydratase [Jeotgalicoccus sp.]
MSINSWSKNLVIEHWPKRDPNSHKSSHGKVGIIAGSELMPGAAALSAGAAVESGAGLTTVNTVRSVIPIVASHVPEATFYHRDDELNGFLEDKAAVAAGPGLGRLSDDIIEDLITNFNGPLVIDADGLYDLNRHEALIRKRESPLIITPHAGEMARIINKDIDYVNDNRYEEAKNLAADYGIYVVLKGPETIVAKPDGALWVNQTGNSGLAKGGTGDVLTGMVLAFIGQSKDIQPAVSNAVYMHGYAADYLIEQGVAIETVTASKVISVLSESFQAALN